MIDTGAPAEVLGDPRVLRTRKRVVEATFELLREGGFEGLSIDAIARRAGVARTTIYRHWDGVGQIMLDCAALLPSAGPEPQRTGEPVASIVRGLADALWRTDFGAMVAASIDASERHPEIEQLLRELAARRSRASVTILREACSPNVSDLEVQTATEMLTGALFRRRLISREQPTEEFQQALITAVRRLLFEPDQPVVTAR